MQGRKIPIIKLGSNLLVSIQVELDDTLALTLQDEIVNEIIRSGAKGLIIDVSAIEIMDSYIARVINNIGNNSQIMGAKAVLVGLQPAIAITLVEMGMDLNCVRTALNLEMGLALLEDGGADDNSEGKPPANNGEDA